MVPCFILILRLDVGRVGGADLKGCETVFSYLLVKQSFPTYMM